VAHELCIPERDPQSIYALKELIGGPRASRARRSGTAISSQQSGVAGTQQCGRRLLDPPTMPSSNADAALDAGQRPVEDQATWPAISSFSA